MAEEATEWAIPVNTKTIHAITYGDLEDLVNKTYGFDKDPGKYGNNLWSFVANEECGNDTDHEFDNTDKYVSDGDKEDPDFIKFRDGEDAYALQFRTSLILWDLAEKGLLPKGDILVSVCW